MVRKKQSGPFIDRATVDRIPQARVRWKATHRLVPTRYPPLNIFERVADPDDWDLLFELEGMTNPRLRQEAGEISLVPPSRRVTGPGASIVMAPFTHISRDRPTRFTAGDYGVYHAANKFETALREVAFHMGRFYASTADEPHEEAYRGYQGSVDARLHDLRKGDWSRFLNPDPAKYGAPQQLARQLREDGSNGIVYPSVRHVTGQCIAAFWPDVVSVPVQTRHVALKWDGEKISEWFDYESGTWSTL